MGETPIIITLILFNIIFLAFVLAIIIFIREYRVKKKDHLKQIHTIDESHKNELLKKQIETQTHTMKHIGRDIHDNVGQKLTLASLYTQQLVFENKSPQVNATIKDVNGLIDESLKELRQLSKSLTDDTIKSHSISELIKKECERVHNLKQCKVTFLNNSKTNLASYQIKSAIFRITQEFLQNSIKHSDCKNILATLNSSQGSIQLLLEDDGIGFNLQETKSQGIGLHNIKKRAEFIGSTITIKSKKSKGTKLILEIPL